MTARRRFELAPSNSTVTRGRAALLWGNHSSPGSFDASVGPWLAELGKVSNVAVGLVRVAAGVFIADRTVRRDAYWQSRQLDLHVQVPAAGPLARASSTLTELLNWLTGDEWTLSFAQNGRGRPRSGEEASKCDTISLFSGGLDSFCGAVLDAGKSRQYVSHSDATSTRGSQNAASKWLTDNGMAITAHHVRLGQPGDELEASRRSRSFLFVALAVALATATGAKQVEIPENGFTTLNSPLAANRGGVLTTRSTHPWTLHLMNRALNDCGLRIRVYNPFEWLTKGELVRAAAESGASGFESGVATTLSSAKPNLRITGLSAQGNCGLCYACIVRRASIVAAGIDDRTNYACETLNAAARHRLEATRRPDTEAVKLALARGVDEMTLPTIGGDYPPGYDFRAGLDVVRRAHRELERVHLP